MNKTAGKRNVDSSVSKFVPFMRKDYDIDIVGVWVRHCEKLRSGYDPSEEHFRTKDAVEHYIMYIPLERKKESEESGKVFIYTLAKCLIHKDGRITNVENLMDYRSDHNFVRVGVEPVIREKSLKDMIENTPNTLFFNTYYVGGGSDCSPVISTSNKLKRAFSSKTPIFEGVFLRKNDIVDYTPNPDWDNPNWEAGDDYLIMTDKYGCLTLTEKGEYMFSGFGNRVSKLFSAFGPEKFRAFNSIPFFDFHPMAVFKAYDRMGEPLSPVDGCTEHIILYYTWTQNALERKHSNNTYKEYTRMARCLISPDGTIGNVVDICSVPERLVEDNYVPDGSKRLTWNWIKEFKTLDRYAFVNADGTVTTTLEQLYEYLCDYGHKPLLMEGDLDSKLGGKIPVNCQLEYVEYGDMLLKIGNEGARYENLPGSSCRFSRFRGHIHNDENDNYELKILSSFRIMKPKVDPKQKTLDTTIKTSSLVESDEKVIFYMPKRIEKGDLIPTIYVSKCKMNMAGEVDIVGSTWEVFHVKGHTYDEIFSTLDNFEFGYSYDVYSGCNITALILKMGSILKIEPNIDHFVNTEEFLNLSWNILKYDGSGNNVIPLHEYAVLNKDLPPMSISVDNLLPNHLIKKMGLDADFYKGFVKFYHTKTLCSGPLDINVDQFDILDPHISIWNTDKEIWNKSFFVCFEYAHVVETLSGPKDSYIITQKLIYCVEKTEENFELLSNFEKDLRYNDERANTEQRRDLIRRLLVTLEMDKKVSKMTKIGRYSTGETLSLELKINTDFEFLFNHRLIKSTISPVSKNGYEYYALQGDVAKK